MCTSATLLGGTGKKQCKKKEFKKNPEYITNGK
jgi:hypothetical protein